jgi:hypothetical protein
MAIAHYRTERGAQRYCDELARKWPGSVFKPVPSTNFGWWVGCYLKSRPIGSAPVYADKRPRNFAKTAIRKG